MKFLHYIFIIIIGTSFTTSISCLAQQKSKLTESEIEQVINQYLDGSDSGTVVTAMGKIVAGNWLIPNSLSDKLADRLVYDPSTLVRCKIADMFCYYITAQSEKLIDALVESYLNAVDFGYSSEIYACAISNESIVIPDSILNKLINKSLIGPTSKSISGVFFPIASKLNTSFAFTILNSFKVEFRQIEEAVPRLLKILRNQFHFSYSDLYFLGTIPSNASSASIEKIRDLAILLGDLRYFSEYSEVRQQIHEYPGIKELNATRKLLRGHPADPDIKLMITYLENLFNQSIDFEIIKDSIPFALRSPLKNYCDVNESNPINALQQITHLSKITRGLIESFSPEEKSKYLTSLLKIQIFLTNKFQQTFTNLTLSDFTHLQKLELIIYLIQISLSNYLLTENEADQIMRDAEFAKSGTLLNVVEKSIRFQTAHLNSEMNLSLPLIENYPVLKSKAFEVFNSMIHVSPISQWDQLLRSIK